MEADADRDAPRHLTEPVPIDDDLCTDLALIEDLEFGARFVLVALQTIYETGEHELVVKRKIVLTDAAIGRFFNMVLRWMGRRGARFARDVLRLVR